MKKTSPPSRVGPVQGFLPSLAFVLGSMVLAGLAQSFYQDFLVPRGLLQASALKLVLGAWAVLISACAVVYARQLYRLLSTVRTSVVILVLFALSCVAGSFILQKRDLDTRGLKGEEAYMNFRLAEAGFLHYLIHGQDYLHPISENGDRFFQIMRERYGDEHADKRIEMFHKMMGARARDAEVEEFAEEYDRYFRMLWRFSQATRLGDIHRSWPFVTLMLLLSMSLLAGTHKRFVWRLSQTGFYLTHLGFVVLMIGFALSMVYEERGILPLEVGKTLDKVWEFNADKPLDLDFQVTLEDFYTEHHNEIFTQFLDVDYQAEGFPGPIQRQLKAYPGTTYELEGGRYEVEVLDASEYGTARPDVVPRNEGPANPAIQIDVTGPDGSGANGWLFALSGSQSFYQDPRGAFVLGFFVDEAQALTLPPRGEWGTLTLSHPEEGVRKLAVRPDSEVEFAGRHIRIGKIAPDFARREAPTDDQQALNPALELWISGEGEEPRARWTFAWIDFDKLHTPIHSDIALTYDFRAGNLDPRAVIRVLQTDAGLELITFDAAGEPSRQPLELHQEIASGVGSYAIKIDTHLRSAERIFRVEPDFERDRLEADRAEAQLPPGEQGHSGHSHPPNFNHGPSDQSPLGPVDRATHRRFHPPGPPAVKLRVRHPGGEFTRWFLSGHPDASEWSDGHLIMRFAPTAQVKEWRSLLTATNGTETRRQVVRVNTTMEFGGWTLYQSDADPKRPNYSGIQILRDPGWYLIEPGLFMVCLGVIFMFWIKPWLRMDQSGGSRAVARKES